MRIFTDKELKEMDLETAQVEVSNRIKVAITVILLYSLLAVNASAKDLFSNITHLGNESYICVADSATGFAFNKTSKKWKSTFFTTENKYIISKSKKAKYQWSVKEVGESYIYSSCKNDFNSGGYIFCIGIGNTFTMNKNTFRFIMTYRLGYLDGIDNDDNTPHIEIGKCSPI
jgi:hypothetical protein